MFDCLNEDSEEWLEDNFGEPIYMVVALHTVLPKPEDESRKQLNTVTGVALLSALLPFGLGYAIGGPMMMSGMHRDKSNLPAAEDQIVAIEYRQIEIRQLAEHELEESDGEVMEGMFSGRLMDCVDKQALFQIFSAAVEDEKGSWIVTPIDEDIQDEKTNTDEMDVR